MPRRKSISGVADPVTLIGVLFLLITLSVGTHVVADKKYDFNIFEMAAKSKKTGNAAFDKCREDSGRETCNKKLGVNVNWKGENVKDTSKVDKGADPKDPTCDANGVQYSAGAVVMYGGIGSNATCGSDGKWDVGVGATTDIKPENVPEYAKGTDKLEKQIEAEKQAAEQLATEQQTTSTISTAEQENLDREKSQCLQEGGFWLANICSYAEQEQAIAKLTPIIQEKQEQITNPFANITAGVSGGTIQQPYVPPLLTTVPTAEDFLKTLPGLEKLNIDDVKNFNYPTIQNQEENKKTLLSNLASLPTQFSNALKGSKLEGLGTYGLGGGNAYVAPVPQNIIKSQNNSDLYNYMLGNTISAGAGFASATLLTPGAPMFVFETATSIPGAIRLLTAADIADNIVTGGACALGNQESCSYFQSTLFIPAPTGVGNMLVDSIDDFATSWAGTGSTLSNLINKIPSPALFNPSSSFDSFMPTNTVPTQTDMLFAPALDSLPNTPARVIMDDLSRPLPDVQISNPVTTVRDWWNDEMAKTNPNAFDSLKNGFDEKIINSPVGDFVFGKPIVENAGISNLEKIDIVPQKPINKVSELTATEIENEIRSRITIASDYVELGGPGAGSDGNTYDDLLKIVKRKIKNGDDPITAVTRTIYEYHPKNYSQISPDELAYKLDDPTAISSKLTCGVKLNCLELPILEKQLFTDLGIDSEVIVSTGGTKGLPDYTYRHGALKVGDQVIGYYAPYPLDVERFSRVAERMKWGNFEISDNLPKVELVKPGFFEKLQERLYMFWSEEVSSLLPKIPKSAVAPKITKPVGDLALQKIGESNLSPLALGWNAYVVRPANAVADFGINTWDGAKTWVKTEMAKTNPNAFYNINEDFSNWWQRNVGVSTPITRLTPDEDIIAPPSLLDNNLGETRPKFTETDSTISQDLPELKVTRTAFQDAIDTNLPKAAKITSFINPIVPIVGLLALGLADYIAEEVFNIDLFDFNGNNQTTSIGTEVKGNLPKKEINVEPVTTIEQKSIETIDNSNNDTGICDNEQLQYMAIGKNGIKMDTNYIPNNLVNTTKINNLSSNNKFIYVESSAIIPLESFGSYINTLGYKLHITSGYRSYGEQSDIHNVTELSAPPGESQHQNGLAVDLYYLDENGKIKELTDEMITKAVEYGIAHPVYGDRPHFYVLGAEIVQSLDEGTALISNSIDDYAKLNESILKLQQICVPL